MLPAAHRVPASSLPVTVTKHVLTTESVTRQGEVLAVCLLAEVHLAVVTGHVWSTYAAVTQLLQLQVSVILQSSAVRTPGGHRWRDEWRG